jgi:DNA integrity scanning protein DisA with diadenylate cyclase activity/mannitol/fructose-specific phosphotransferase system IIA component (Ntr-type)
MAFEQYCALPAVVDLKSEGKAEALHELATALCKALDIRKPKIISDEIQKREESASTFIGHGLALPQARGPIKEEFAVAVGRSLRGIEYNAARGALAHLIVLLVSRDDADSGRHIQLLAEIADFFKTDAVREMILSQEGPIEISALLKALTEGKGGGEKAGRSKRKAGTPILRAAASLSRDIKASAIMVFADAVRDNDFIDQLTTKARLVVVTSNRTRFELVSDRRIKGFLQAPPIPASRTGQIKIGILLALSRNLIQREDRVVCVSGNSNTGVFDTVVVIDVAREYDFFFTAAENIVPPDVKPEVLERIIALSGEIAVEGREGKPVGTIFVLGDTNSVNAHVRQLIINPFRGYSEAERNILDPSLAETIKEFAGIDGAFIITGDGIVLSAGSYLRPNPVDEQQEIPSGFGARHFAAAGITACTNALAVAVSESTGMVTLFKNGVAMMALARPVRQEKSLVQRFL